MNVTLILRTAAFMVPPQSKLTRRCLGEGLESDVQVAVLSIRITEVGFTLTCGAKPYVLYQKP